MEIIRAEGLRFAYEGQETPVLNDVSLSIQKGEWLTIVGHNGSGKSTFVKLLNGLFLPQEGRVVVDGMDTADEQRIWDIRKRVGMVFQNPDNQLVATVVEEDVAFGLENLGYPPLEIQRRVREALEKVRMDRFAQSAPHMLSGGQKQRVAIAGILAMEPDVLLMDEPTAMLDPSGRREVIETVRQLHEQQGITVVHVTHFMQEALLADRVVVMEKGRIVEEAPPRALFTDLPRLKALGLESPPMAELAHRLRQQGMPLPETIMTVEEMVNALCPLL